MKRWPGSAYQRKGWAPCQTAVRLGALVLFLLFSAAWAPGAFAVDLQITNLSDTGSDPTPAGGIVTYDITIENSAADTANGVFTLFDLPAGTSAVNLPSFCSIDVGVPTRVVCSNDTLVGTLGGGDPVSFQLQVDTAGLPQGSIILQSAIVREPLPPAATPLESLPDSDPFFAGDTNAGNNTASQNTTLIAAGDLALTKIATPDPVVAGAEITYAIEVANNGPSPSTNFNVVDTLPAGTTFIAGRASGTGWTFSGPNGTFAGTLAVGASATYTFRARVDASSGTLQNSAVVNAVGTPDPVAGNNTGTATVTVAAGADLQMQKTATPTPALPGQPITFTLTVTNDGPSPAANVSFSDPMPPGFLITGFDAPPAGWNCAVTGGDTIYGCTLISGELAVGASQVFTVEALVPSNVIGIGYPLGADISTERTLDLTPVPANDEARVKAPSGGGDAFLDFIQNDLKPALYRDYQIDRSRESLMGHSFGGCSHCTLCSLARTRSAITSLPAPRSGTPTACCSRRRLPSPPSANQMPRLCVCWSPLVSTSRHCVQKN